MTTTSTFRKSLWPPNIQFTIVELAVAVFVIVFGFNGVVSLISAGLQSKNRAVGENTAADAVVQFLNLAKNEILQDWDWTQAFPDSKSTLVDSYVGWGSNPVFDLEYMTVDFAPDVIAAEFDPSVHQDGLFRIRQSNGSSAELTSIVRVWKVVGSSFTDTSGDLVLHAEVSWPAEVPYAERSKEVFSIDIYKAPVTSISSADEGGGISTRVTDSGVVVQVTEVHEGSRVVTMTVTGATLLDGSLTNFFVSCPHSSVTSYSNTEGYSMSLAYSSGAEGFLLSGMQLASGDTCTISYTLALDAVPDTTIVAMTDSSTGTLTTPLMFTEENFEYVYSATESISNFVKFTAASGGEISESAGKITVEIGLQLSTGTALDSDLTVQLLTVDGAGAGADDCTFSEVDGDQTVQLGSVTFAKGSANGAVESAELVIVDDDVYEGNECLILTAAVVTGNARMYGPQSLYTVTIADNETAPEDDSPAPGSTCTDTVTGKVLTGTYYSCVFDVNFVKLSNTSNYPMTKVQFLYVGSSTYDSTIISVNIANGQGFVTVFGKTGKKIKKMKFTRSNNSTSYRTSDVVFCP